MKFKKIEQFSRFISNIIIKNIPLFIISSFLGLTGLNDIQSILIKFGIPIALAYSTANNIEKKNGGIIAIVATCAIATCGGFSSLLGPIIIGIICGYIVKGFNKLVKKFSFTGYEMISNNLGLAIIGILIAFSIKLFLIPIEHLKHFIPTEEFNMNVSKDILIFFSIIIEPLKVFFMNNIINHGVFSVIGNSQVKLYGKSIYFLLETNPGPGFGLLLAIYFYKKKKEALSNSLMVLIGGVHELYFIYVLRRLYLLFPLIIGSLVGVMINYTFNTGLEGIASPGSIIMIELLSPSSDRLIILFSIFSSAITTFYLSSFLLKSESSDIDKKINSKKENITQDIKEINNSPKNILIVCDAGMGSSAMAASFLKQKLLKKGITDISVDNSSIHNFLEKPFDLVIMHAEIYKRMKNKPQDINIITIEDFLDSHFYDQLINKITENTMPLTEKIKEHNKNNNSSGNSGSKNIFDETNIKIGLKRVTKEEALKNIGEHLIEKNYVSDKYAPTIFEREELSNTYLENGVALPHGTQDSKKYIKKSGIVIHQYPYGIDYGNNETVYILIGIAAKGEEHLNMITKLAKIIDSDEQIDKLCLAIDESEILETLNLGGSTNAE